MKAHSHLTRQAVFCSVKDIEPALGYLRKKKAVTKHVKSKMIKVMESASEAHAKRSLKPMITLK